MRTGSIVKALPVEGEACRLGETPTTPRPSPGSLVTSCSTRRSTPTRPRPGPSPSPESALEPSADMQCT